MINRGAHEQIPEASSNDHFRGKAYHDLVLPRFGNAA
jgi:hypothetical protein